MNEQKYTEIMKGIRREYIDEAVTWDGSEQKRSREIRRTTIGICGIAASIVVVAGFLFYGARKNQTQRISTPQAISDSEKNFLGGHGELKPYLSTGDQIVLRDAEYCYLMPVTARGEQMINRWRPEDPYRDDDSIRGDFNGIMEAIGTDHSILSDGERMYEADWRKLWIIDSKGVLTAFFTLTTDCPGYNLTDDLLKITGVQHLTGDWYAIRYEFPQGDGIEQYEVIYNAGTKEILSAERASVWRLSVTGDGTGYYEVDPEGYVCRHSFTDRDFCEQIYPVMRNMSDLRLCGDKLYFTSNYVGSDDLDYRLSSTVGLGCYCIDLTSEDKTVVPVAKKVCDGPYYLGDSVIYSVHTDGDGQWRVCSLSYDEPEKEQELFSVPFSQLFGNPVQAYELTMIFTQADDLLIFNLPLPAVNNAEYVQIDADMQAIYLSHAAPPLEEDIMGDNSCGYVTEDSAFSEYFYIPPEHTAERTDEIQCYRMLPYRNAWESELDPSVFFGFNENRGDAPRITKERAMEICYESGSFLEAAQKLLEEGGWDVAWTSGIIGEEIWLDDRGKELIFVHQFDGITYYRYDETARQYYFERLRGDDSGSADSKQPDQPDSTVSANEPQYYEFTEWEVRTDGYHEGVQYPQVFFIRSRAELDDYIERNKSLYQFEFAEGGDSYYSFVEAAARYPESWFEDHQLILVLLEEGSGSIRHSLADLSDTGLTVIRTVPEVGTDDMAEWHLFIETDKANTFAAPEDFTVSFETRQ